MSKHSKDWSVISFECKKAAGFRCSKCFIVFSGGGRKLLGVHHKNKDPLNDETWNLEVLCWSCHKRVERKSIRLFPLRGGVV
jgi:5-methylcytosine-specific restriction endonuclease McrA